jgi:hypothetical protein
MEPPHYDSKRWTGDPELAQQDYDRRALSRSIGPDFAPKHPLQLPGKLYFVLILSCFLPLFANWLVEGSTALLSPPVGKFQLLLWLGLVLLGGLAGLIRQSRLQLSIAKMGIALMLFSSMLHVLIGTAAWTAAVGDSPSRAVVVHVSYSRNSTTATMVLADGSVASMRRSNYRYRPTVDQCVVTRRWTGPAGYAWIELLGPAASPATGEPLTTEDPRLCFAGERAQPAKTSLLPSRQQQGVFLLIFMIVGAGLIYLFLVRSAARMVDRKAK